jgi:hypothetical protein
MGDSIPATYQYLDREKVVIDGVDHPSESSIVEPGRAHIYTMTFTGQAIDRAVTNVSMLCPVVVFVDNTGKRAGIVCFRVSYAVSRSSPIIVGDHTDVSRHLLSSGNVDEACRIFHIL